jgi:hypothetical protein
VISLIVATSCAGGESFTNLVAIQDRALVRSIFEDLALGELVSAKRYLLVAPKLVVFVDEHQTPVRSFLYWPAGKPEHIFTACEAEWDGHTYRVKWPATRTVSVALPGFDKRMRPYMDVWR